MRWPQRTDGQEVGGAAHALGAGADGDIDVAQQDVLRGRDDRLQARAAQAVHGEAGRSDGKAGLDGGHARDVHVARFAVHDVAEHHVADARRVDLGARDGFLDRERSRACVAGMSFRAPP